MKKRIFMAQIIVLMFVCSLCLAFISQESEAATLLAEKWYVRLYNIDDSAYAYVNGVKVAETFYYGDSGWKDVTKYVTKGSSTPIRFILWNGGYGYTWGFKIGRKMPNESSITTMWSDVKGQVGSYGANNNDQSRTYQWVYDKTKLLSSILGNKFGYPLSSSSYPESSYRGYGVFNWVTTIPKYKDKYHTGCDISVPNALTTDVPVYPTADGTVVYAGYKEGWGNVVIVKHKFTSTGEVYSQYAHLKKILTAKDKSVYKGQTELGYVGKTGFGTGPHLHFEIKKYNAGGSLSGPGYTSNPPNLYGYFDPVKFIKNY